MPRAHDLPPAWDGQPVEWMEWSPEARSSLFYHSPIEQMTCRECGTVDEPRTCSGRRGDLPVWDLIASRCRHCGHDQVTETQTWQTWDLEPEDYTDAGSWPEAETPALF